MKYFILFSLAIFLMPGESRAQLPSYVPANGLFAWWPFNGNADDLSGNGHHGTVFGASITADRLGNANSAYNFADSAYIITDSTGNLPLDSAARTITLWLKTNQSSSPANHDVFGYGRVSPSNAFYFTIFGFFPFFCGAYNDLDGSGEITDDAWHFVAITYNGTNVSIYVDGILNASGPKHLDTKLSEVIFGRSPLTHPTPYFYTGLLDDCGIWNRVLTQQEITGLFNSINTRTSKSLSSGSLKIGPNPANNYLYIQKARTSAASQTLRLELTDLQGKKLRDWQMPSGSDEDVRFELSGLPNGFYLLNLDFGNTYQTRKIQVFHP